MHVKSLRGVSVDMGLMLAKHEESVAIGNASMNARGDIINQSGQIVKKREQISKEYYSKNPKAVGRASNVSLKDISGEVLTPAAAVQQARDEIKKKRKISESEE